jgi:hypothetical protein
MTKKRVTKFGSLFLLFLSLVRVAAIAQDKVIRISEGFVKQGINSHSLLDRSRILLGLTTAAELKEVPEFKKSAWADFLKTHLPALVQDLTPSKEEDQLEAAAKIIELSRKYPIPGLEARLEDWKKWALGPRFIGPENDIGRLGIALILLHTKPDPAALKYAETLLEAMIDASQYENEMHRFGIGPNGQPLAHLLLHRVVEAPVRTVHHRKLNWILVTHYKYLTRKMAGRLSSDYHFEDALLEHGLLQHVWLHGEKLLREEPAPLDLAHYYSVAARYAAERQKDEIWMGLAKSRSVPRLVVTAEEWEKMISRNKSEAYAAEPKRFLEQGAAALALNVPVYYEPAPNLDERGKTNEKAGAVGRKMGPLRAAYLATGEDKWGTAYKEVVMAQVKQYEDYGDFRCYYNLNVPGPWDGLNAVISYTSAYDILAAKGLLGEDEKNRIIRMVREIGRELEWSIAYSNFIVHNYWARLMGSMGFLTNYWTDMPEASAWKALVESKLPFLFSGIDKDGGWWEKTINYHIFTLDLLETWFSAAKRLHGVDLFAREFNGRHLEMMLDWLVKITPPGGEVPLFNDGQKLNLKNSGPALGMARALRRGDFFKAINLPPDRVPASEPEAPKIEWRTPNFTSVLMEESGYGVFRSGWEPDDIYFAVKFGEHGGGHGHYDKGSIYVQAFGRPWLIDPGYGQRETLKHNTVLVDGRDQEAATGKLQNWYEGEKVNLVSVSHRAYKHIDHRRTVLYIKPDALLVVDRLTPLDGLAHTYDWHLQFNSDNGKSTGTSWLTEAQGSGIKVIFPENDPDAARELRAALNVNELPSNFQKMGNESLYLEIWRGKWTKKNDKPVVFAALIKAFQGREPVAALSQKPTKDGVILEMRDASGKSVFEVKWDGHYAYTGADGKRTIF